jgi:hypothetical protein
MAELFGFDDLRFCFAKKTKKAEEENKKTKQNIRITFPLLSQSFSE